jgi:hypothetical protein
MRFSTLWDNDYCIICVCYTIDVVILLRITTLKSCSKADSAKGSHILSPTGKTTNVIYKEFIFFYVHLKNVQHLHSQE